VLADVQAASGEFNRSVPAGGLAQRYFSDAPLDLVSDAPDSVSIRAK
jgi:hypothetical protein